jgi:hypothetical protein
VVTQEKEPRTFLPSARLLRATAWGDPRAGSVLRPGLSSRPAACAGPRTQVVAAQGRRGPVQTPLGLSGVPCGTAGVGRRTPATRAEPTGAAAVDGACSAACGPQLSIARGLVWGYLCRLSLEARDHDRKTSAHPRTCPPSAAVGILLDRSAVPSRIHRPTHGRGGVPVCVLV